MGGPLKEGDWEEQVRGEGHLLLSLDAFILVVLHIEGCMVALLGIHPCVHFILDVVLGASLIPSQGEGGEAWGVSTWCLDECLGHFTPHHTTHTHMMGLTKWHQVVGTKVGKSGGYEGGGMKGNPLVPLGMACIACSLNIHVCRLMLSPSFAHCYVSSCSVNFSR